mmetsp:Transcript_15947/g.25828  ORF Transcript_15947/g.25828 Transcript_15947/m.25828 type:complete len:247 (-) Transcript_15947:517-1257(-)
MRIIVQYSLRLASASTSTEAATAGTSTASGGASCQLAKHPKHRVGSLKLHSTIGEQRRTIGNIRTIGSVIIISPIPTTTTTTAKNSARNCTKIWHTPNIPEHRMQYEWHHHHRMDTQYRLRRRQRQRLPRQQQQQQYIANLPRGTYTPPHLPIMEDNRIKAQPMPSRLGMESNESRIRLLPLRRRCGRCVRSNRIREGDILELRVREGGCGEVRRLEAVGDLPVWGDLLRCRCEVEGSFRGVGLGE